MELSSRFTDAFHYALQVHGRQTRKGKTTPYAAHLMGVAALVLEDGGDEDMAIAALLHDAPEDQGGRAMLEDIRRRFGERVAQIVEGCTDTFETPKPAWQARKERYIDHLRHAPADTRRVSLADKLYNAQSLLADLIRDGEQVWARFTASKAQTMWYYRSLATVFTAEGAQDGPMANELLWVVNKLDELA